MFENFAVISPSLLENHIIIINISKLALFDTNFGFNFSISNEQKCFIFGICVQFESTFQISNFISLTNF